MVLLSPRSAPPPSPRLMSFISDGLLFFPLSRFAETPSRPAFPRRNARARLSTRRGPSSGNAFAAARHDRRCRVAGRPYGVRRETYSDLATRSRDGRERSPEHDSAVSFRRGFFFNDNRQRTQADWKSPLGREPITR